MSSWTVMESWRVDTSVHNRVRYQSGCRCDTCTAAERDYRRRYRERHDGPRRTVGFLLVTCWCEAILMRVPKPDVMAGQTRSCSRPGCGP